MAKTQSPAMTRMLSIYQNNLILLTIIAILLGLLLRFLANPKPLDDVSELGRELMREVGTFILVTFLVAFLNEFFVSVRNREEFRSEIQELLSNKMQLGIQAVYTRRPDVAFKAEILREAQGDLYEVGEALNTFQTYITSNMSTGMGTDAIGYRDLLEQRLKEGLNVTCLMLDPQFAASSGITNDQPGMVAKIENSKMALERFADAMNAKNVKGKFRIYQYHSVPRFAAIYSGTVSGDARLLLSPYIPYAENSSTPVFDLRRSENAELFDKYIDGIQKLLHEAKGSAVGATSTHQAPSAAASAVSGKP